MDVGERMATNVEDIGEAHEVATRRYEVEDVGAVGCNQCNQDSQCGVRYC